MFILSRIATAKRISESINEVFNISLTGYRHNLEIKDTNSRPDKFFDDDYIIGYMYGFIIGEMMGLQINQGATVTTKDIGDILKRVFTTVCGEKAEKALTIIEIEDMMAVDSPLLNQLTYLELGRQHGITLSLYASGAIDFNIGNELIEIAKETVDSIKEKRWAALNKRDLDGSIIAMETIVDHVVGKYK